MDHPEPDYVCPHCGGSSPHQTPRYRRALCVSCMGRLTDARGRAVGAYNESFMGTGFVVLHADDQSRCASATAEGRVFIDGRPYSAAEARFGGVVVQPLGD